MKTVLGLATIMTFLPGLLTPQSRTDIDGEWSAKIRRGGKYIELQLERTDRRSRYGDWLPTSDFQGLQQALASETSEDVRFELVRDAGTFAFEGQFRGSRGVGEFRFLVNST